MIETESRHTENVKEKGRDRIGKILYFLYLCFLFVALLIIGRIIYIQMRYTPDPELAYLFKSRNTKKIIKPSRGSILAQDGRLLAMSIPMYDIYMDCSVMKEEFEKKKDKAKAKELEQEWREKAKLLSQSLPKVLKMGNSEKYYKQIIQGREKNNRYLRLARQVDQECLKNLKSLPLFEEGQYKGGLIVEKNDTRQYPYAALARRTIGYVCQQANSYDKNIGIEGKFNYILHGKEGYEWMRETDGKKRIQNLDSTAVKSENGKNIRTTLDIDIQDIADRALKEQIEKDLNIESACTIIMEVKSGAIRAMVNLVRDTSDNSLNESYNIAVGRSGEPGSVFKTAILMALLEDNHIKSLNTRISTNNGQIAGIDNVDQAIIDYENKYKENSISILDAFKLSLNYPFRYLAIKHYYNNSKALTEKLFMCKFNDNFDFDLHGLRRASLPDNHKLSKSELASIAIGYTTAQTPLHILSFYNAIANKGKMMKPYLVESIEENGIAQEKRGQSILNASICSRSTADTLTRALREVTREGTAAKLKNSKLEIAGKTGTAWIILDPKYTNGKHGLYVDGKGRRRYQASFVGFFPAKAPKYSIIVTVYSKLSSAIYFGSGYPSAATGEIVDKIYALQNCWGEQLSQKDGLPRMGTTVKNNKKEQEKIRLLSNTKGNITVPLLLNLGLKEAIYKIENNGFSCSYKGSGHVVRQSPKALSKAAKGSTINIELE